MSPSKREREYARRRYERYQQRVLAQRTKRRKQRRLAGAILIVLVLVLGGIFAAGLSNKTPAAAASPSPSASTSPTASATFTLPDPSLAQARIWTGTITTNLGAIGIELYGDKAPQAVASFVSLAQQGFFNGTSCHRLALGIHILQCGDPTGTGSGGPGYTFGPIENAPVDNLYPVNAIAMARPSGNGAGMGSQFFLVYADSSIPADSAGGYTVFGRITSGLDVVTAVADAGVKDGKSDGLPVTGVTIQGVETQ